MIFFRYRDDTFEVVNILEGHRDIEEYFGAESHDDSRQRDGGQPRNADLRPGRLHPQPVSGGTTSQMRAETLVIPAVVATALGRQRGVLDQVARRIRHFDPWVLVTVARGTSDHAAEYTIRLVGCELGFWARACPPRS